MANIEKEIGDLLKQKGLTIGAVESGTGGLISHLITNVPGSSEYFKGAVVSYANETKMKAVGVGEETLKRYGAVSPQVAEEMAMGGKKVLNVDICLADTGIAGPGGATPSKAVGLFYLSLANKDDVSSRKLELTGDRVEIKQKVAQAALEWLKEYLISI
ncbi:MAG: CinA family protein [Dehalococcoidales bacterium]|nr:CinA family protein [Dehalococcoidales bacterium]